MYFVEYLKIIKDQISQGRCSSDFKSEILQLIDAKLLLLRRNMSAMVQITQTLRGFSIFNRLFWEGLEEVVANTTMIGLIENPSNLDLIDHITYILYGMLNGQLSHNMQNALSEFITTFYKTDNPENLGYKSLHKCLRMSKLCSP